MILEKQKEANVLQIGESQDSIGMSLDLDSAQILMQMLSKNLYSDPIGSTIRECASNALDSHRRAGVTKPIVVAFKITDSNTYEFSVEDFGIGLDADDVENIISKYGKSTKRNSDTELGMMGLGFKAPLAYSSSFYFVCRKNGVERKYMMYEGEDVNTIDLLYTRETTEDNGVKVIVPVSYVDKWSFINKIKEQLAYFENVYFDVLEDEISNDFVIFRGTDYQFSEMASDSYLHICLDNVYYPIDFKKLGIDAIPVKLGLRFGLNDKLFPTPNRESIKYSAEAKEIILNKISKVADYFIKKYNNDSETITDVYDLIDYYDTTNRFINLSNSKFNISQLAKHTTSQLNEPKVEGIEISNIRDLVKIKEYWLYEYIAKYRFYQNRTTGERHIWDFNPRYLRNIDVYFYEGKIPGVKKDYLKSISNNSTILVVSKTKSLRLGTDKDVLNGGYNCYRNILNLKKYPKSEWRQRISEYQKLVSMIISTFKPIDELVVPDYFIQSRKRAKVLVKKPSVVKDKVSGEIVIKKAVPLQRYVGGRNCKFESELLNLSKVDITNRVIIYGSNNDQSLLDKYYLITKPYGYMNVEIVIISDKDAVKIKDMKFKNVINIHDFINKKTHKIYKRIVTAALIDDLMSNNKSFFNHSDMIRHFSNEMSNKITKLKSYKKDYSNNEVDAITKLSLIESLNIRNFDSKIYDEYLEVKNFIDKYSYISDVLSRVYSWAPQKCHAYKCMTDIFRYNKIKLNLDFYIKKEEEVKEEEED